MADLFEILIGKEGEKDYKKKPVIVQGITGKFGSFHTQQMLAYGTNIVAGVTPGKGGQKFENVPIYEKAKEAVDTTGTKISIVFVPAKFFKDAAIEALEAGIKILIAIPEHVPVRDAMIVLDLA
ncbi:MAG: succinate--CoA ligase subunit alpha, partial [Thermoproteota archaeon]